MNDDDDIELVLDDNENIELNLENDNDMDLVLEDEEELNAEIEENLLIIGDKNIIEKIEVNGVEQPVENKTVNIVVPKKTSDLENDSGFITENDIPEIPSKTSDLENDSGFITDEDYVHTDNNFSNNYKNKVDNTNIYYAICTDHANIQTRVITIPNFQLKTGTQIRILFTTAQNYNREVYLYVSNSEYPAKEIWSVNTAGNYKIQYMWQAGEVVDLVYDGTKYIMVGKAKASTSYYGITKLNNSINSNSQTEAATPYAINQVSQIAQEVHDDFYNIIQTNGDGNKFLSDDGTYYEIQSGSDSGDITIPKITISVKTSPVDNKKILLLNFGKCTKAFENYVKQNGVQIHLLKYTRTGRRTWTRYKEDEETGELIGEERLISNIKKWVHPANQYIDKDNPSKQCWGIRSYQRFEEYEGQIDEIIENADYFIPNDGIVQSEYNLTWHDFNRGYKEIRLDDIMACIVKKYQVQNEDMDFLPFDGDNMRVRMMGSRVSHRRARQRQPIKFVFAIHGPKGMVYGESNTALLELLTYRLTDEEGVHREIGYTGGFLPDIGYGVLIK